MASVTAGHSGGKCGLLLESRSRCCGIRRDAVWPSERLAFLDRGLRDDRPAFANGPIDRLKLLR